MKIWQVDSFSQTPFKGNPAGVMILNDPLSDDLMQNISNEMNLSETAFLLLRKDQLPLIRFFTPKVEIDLCGHATLATAHIYFREILPTINKVTFDTKSAGQLTITKNTDSYTMDFPSRPGKQLNLDEIPASILDTISSEKPIAVYQDRDLMLVYDNEEIIRNANPDFGMLGKTGKYIIITSKSSEYDYILRFFCAKDGILEDPVTGSAQCMLAPYWAKELGKSTLSAYQLSQRGGHVNVRVADNRVFITGPAFTVLEGHLTL